MNDPAKHDSILDTLKLHQKTFNLVPKFLEHDSRDIDLLEWEEVKFSNDYKDDIPDERGLYAFTIHSSKTGLPMHGYIMYIGISGDNSSATLKKRFYNYLNDQQSITLKRPKVREMLIRWKKVLYFQFTVVPDLSTDLHDLEQRLNDTFQSPCVTNDFTAEVRSARRAFS